MNKPYKGNIHQDIGFALLWQSQHIVTPKLNDQKYLHFILLGFSYSEFV